MTDPVFKLGDKLVLTGAQQTSVTVTLASENGRSLMVEFDGAIRLGEGVYIGGMPLFLSDNGEWISVVDGSVVALAKMQ